jgi:hypothetical protein
MGGSRQEESRRQREQQDSFRQGHGISPARNVRTLPEYTFSPGTGSPALCARLRRNPLPRPAPRDAAEVVLAALVNGQQTAIHSPREGEAMRLVLCVILTVWTMAAHADEREAAAVAALDAELNGLIRSHAGAAAAGYYAPGFVLTTSSGTRKAKSDMLRDIESAGVVLAINETRDVQVRVLRDTAVLTAILHQQGAYNGADFDVELWVTDTWVRGGEHGWLLFAGQATRIQKKAL